MDWGTRQYGGITAAVGLAGIWAGWSMNLPDVSILSSLLLVVGGLLVYLALDVWCCSMCGQMLGRVMKPSECVHCGSNQMSQRDPAVGDTMRAQQ